MSSATSDESSISTTADHRERQKRSQSTDTRKEKTQRKLVIDLHMEPVLDDPNEHEKTDADQDRDGQTQNPQTARTHTRSFTFP